MRITNNMLVNNMMNNIGNNLNRMSKYQNQLATGKKIAVPSDDPVVAARALKLRTDVAEVDQYKRNTGDAQSWMDITDSTLSNIGNVMQRARELAVQASNGTNTTDDANKINEEVKQLKTQLIHLSNTTYAGRYIFSGFKTDSKLIVDDESSPDFGTFAINVNRMTEKIIYEIGVGDNIAINVTGGDLFNNGGNAGTNKSLIGNGTVSSLTIGATNNILNMTVDGETISATIPSATYTDGNALVSAIQTAVNAATATAADISVLYTNGRIKMVSGTSGVSSNISINTATSNAVTNLGLLTYTQGPLKGTLIQDLDNFITNLQKGDNAAVSSLLSDFDKDMENLLRIRADVGARQNRIDLTTSRLENDTVNFTKLMSENEDVDMAETIMNLQNEENVYKASLSGGAKIIQPSLVDFLR